jgi:hypothetical protein
MYFYKAYNLILESEIEIPELPVVGCSSHEADIRVHFGDVPLAPHSGVSLEDGRAFRLDDECLLYAKNNCGRFLIQGESEIVVAPDPGIEERVMRLSLFGPALGLLLIQRGYLVLHGGAVAFGDEAALLLGPGGAGKSTLTGELCRQGGKILTDDVVVVETRGEACTVMPGVPLLKLWPDAVEDAPEGVWSRELHPDFDKVGRRLDDKQLAEPTPVGQVVLLAGGESLDMTPVLGTDAFRALMMSLFATRYGDEFVSGLNPRHAMDQVSGLLRTASVTLLQRPRDRSLLEESAKLVRDCLREH